MTNDDKTDATENERREESAPRKPLAHRLWHPSKRWLIGTTNPVWITIVMTLILSPLTSYVTSRLSDSNRRIVDNHVMQIHALMDAMTQFSIHAPAFAMDLLEKRAASSEVRRALVQNLSEQYARIENVSAFVPKDKTPIVNEYKDAIVRMNATINATNTVDDMRKFYSDASYFLVERNKINELLRSLAEQS